MKAFIYGAGAQGKLTLDTVRAQGNYDPIEFIDDNEYLWGTEVNGARVVGNLEFALEQDLSTFKMIVAIGHPVIRAQTFQKLKGHSISLLNAIHPRSVIAPTATIGGGNWISCLAEVSTDARIGDNNIIYSGTLVEHDAVIEDGVLLSAGVVVSGRAKVKKGAIVGIGAIIMLRKTVGVFSVVAAGSLVTKDVPERTLVMGTPARIIKKIDESFDWNKLL